MANRAERHRNESREGRAQSAKRGKRNGLHSHLVKLARAYAGNRPMMEPRIDEPGFDKAISEGFDSLREIVGGDFLGFADILADDALHVSEVAMPMDPKTGRVMAGAKPMAAFGRLFLLNVEGTDEDIHATFGSSEWVDRFTKIFRKSGLAHEDSSVIVASRMFEPEDLTHLFPGDLRAIARKLLKDLVAAHGMATRWRPPPGTPKAKIDDPIGDVASCDPAAITIDKNKRIMMNRVAIGLRLQMRPLVDDGTFEGPSLDYMETFMPTAVALTSDKVDWSDKENDLTVRLTKAHEADVLKWWTSVRDLCADTTIGIGMPVGHHMACASMAHAILAQKLALEHGWNKNADHPDRVVHVHYGAAVVTVAVVDGARTLPWIQIPGFHVAVGINGFLESLNEIAGDRIMMHIELETMPEYKHRVLH